MAKKKEVVLSQLDIPERPGWKLETIVDRSFRISVAVRNEFTGARFQIATLTEESGLRFDRETLLWEGMSKPQMMAHFTLHAITQRDKQWRFDGGKEEGKKPFWNDYVNELPNFLEVVRVMMT